MPIVVKEALNKLIQGPVRRLLTPGVFWVCFSLAFPGYGGSLVVGRVGFSRGGNAAQQTGQTPRLLGKGSEIFQGDHIQTSERSFVIIDFIDGAKVTVRPNSSFSIDHYQAQTASPAARLSLHQGGLRAESGTIARQSPENFQIKTAVATVKAQQADYSIRLCEHDCQQEQKQPGADLLMAKPLPTVVVARISDLKGEVSASNASDPSAPNRRLSIGAPLYAEDRLVSKNDSYALMVFRDGEKITLQANSEMAIADYSYQQPDQPDHVLYQLTTGGMRVLTGKIGKTNKKAFAVTTPVGTIGIRGTGFDLTCVGSCVNAQQAPALSNELLLTGQPTGMYTHVWQGQIALVNAAGEFVFNMPESHYTATPNSKALAIDGIPEMLFKNPFPRPVLNQTAIEKLFASTKRANVPPGLYVAVHRGHVLLDKNTIAGPEDAHLNLGANEVAHVGDGKTWERLENQKRFQQQDPYLSPMNPASRSKKEGIYSGLLDPESAATSGKFECTTP